MARFLPVSARVGAGVRRAGVDLWVVAGGSRRMRWLTASLAQSHASMGGWGGVSRDKNKIKNCAREAQAATGAARVHVLESRGERGQSKTRGPATAAAGAWRARETERESPPAQRRTNHTRTRRWLVLCVARYVFLQRTLKLWEARVGALGGARATITRNDALARAVRFTGVPYLATSEARRHALAALPHRAQSSVRVNATLLHPHSHLQCLLAYTWGTHRARAYGAVRRVHSFFPSSRCALRAG